MVRRLQLGGALALMLLGITAIAVSWFVGEQSPHSSDREVNLAQPTATVTITASPTTDPIVAATSIAPREPSSTPPEPTTSSPQAATEMTPWPGASLSIEDRSRMSPDVQSVQRRLNELGYGPVVVDGYYGPQLAASVRSFQTDASLVGDGVVNAVTWSAMFDASAAATSGASATSQTHAASINAPVPPPTKNTLMGTFNVPDINGALVTHVGGYPGQPLDQFGMAALNKLERLLKSLAQGETYPCPLGAGGGYKDISNGTQVAVRDGQGNLMATSRLTGGVVTLDGCTFSYLVTVPDVPFYEVTVSHRGGLVYSRDELRANKWRVSGTL